MSNIKLHVRLARVDDEPTIMPLIDAARCVMRATGNHGQWIDGYPSSTVVHDDISSGCGYVVVPDNDSPVAYFAMYPSPEPTYANIYDGAWLDEKRPYMVVHRLGALPQVHGIFECVMDFCLEQCHNVRVDTHEDNVIMLHCLKKSGFTYCGVIYLASGDKRLAFQRLI